MYSIGVDLGGTNIVVGLIDKEHKIVSKVVRPTKKERTSEAIVEEIAAMCKEIITINSLKKKDISYIGVGSPGICDSKEKVIRSSANLNFSNVNIEKEMKKYLDYEIYLSNDANCAAYGEFMEGAGKLVRSTVVITLGTGVGGGVITNGVILEGSTFSGGELGHMVINVDGRQCNCGRKGCMEAYCSATALAEIANEVAKINKNCLLNKLNDGDAKNTTAKMVFDAFDKGDKYIKVVVEDFYKNLAQSILNYINIFDPEVIIIGGGVSGRGDRLIEPVIKLIKLGMYGKEELKTKIKISELGNDAGLIGAGLLNN